jgi:hypothetical protein
MSKPFRVLSLRSLREVKHGRWRFQAHHGRRSGRDRDGKHSGEEWRRSLDSSPADGRRHDSRQIPRGM